MDSLRAWFAAHGGSFHPAVVLDPQGPFGVSVLAPRLDVDTTIVTCPFSLIITKHAALNALKSILGPDAHAPLDTWSERQLICVYRSLSLASLVHDVPHSSPGVLRHFIYVQCLPATADLMTPHQFTTTEREILRGTNLYGATLDRERDWRANWVQCRSLVQSVNPAWGDAFTWDMYMTASTHLSCRAFPSTMLSPDPSLVSTPSTYPVLIPCVDLMNHKRGQPVSWIISCQDQDTTTPNTISIIVHPKSDDADTAPREELVEVFNNYGPKPNDELILGYGFSLPDNPDDTITLQIGGAAASQKWVIGRHAHNVEGLWSDVRHMIAKGDSDYEFEDDLETAAVLADMVQAKLDGIKTVADVRRSEAIRPAVRVMLEHYVAGQRDILESILESLDEKRKAAIETAREQGIDLVFDEEDDD
ncbi:SET domain-containing protein [Imleria badia]|nr:SET domain-containing protein [Imleria badia]